MRHSIFPKALSEKNLADRGKAASKRLAVFFGLLAVFLLPQAAAAQSGVNFGLEYGSAIGLGTQDIRETAARIIKIALGILGIVVTLIIMYGGYVWMTAGGNEQRVSTAKKIIINGVIGLLIIILAYALTVWIFSVIIGGTTGGGNNSCNEGEIQGCTQCVGGTWVYDGTLPGCALPGSSFRVKDVATSHIGSDPAQGVSLCSRVQPRFGSSVDAASVNAAVTAGELRIETFTGDWQTAGNSVTFKHDDTLFSPFTSYRLMLPKQGNSVPLRDLSNLALTICDPIVGCGSTNSHFTWDFTTGNQSDDSAPEITSTYPVSDINAGNYPDRNVSRAPLIDVNFSEEIDATTVVGNNNHPLAGRVTIENISGQGGSVVTTLPNDMLNIFMTGNGFELALVAPNLFDEFSWYRITVQDVEDLCGNAMTDPVVWEFQTNDSVPGVIGFYPTGSNQCLNTDIIITFGTSMYDQVVTMVITGNNGVVYSASMRPSILEPGPYQVAGSGGSFSVADPGVPVSTHFRSFRFQPTGQLALNTTYTVDVTTDLVVNGNGDTLGKQWTFATSDPASCTCSPYISSISPGQGMAGQCVTVNGSCFTGTGNEPAVPTAMTFNNISAPINGYGNNYLTTTIPENIAVNTQAAAQVTITYNNGALGSISSNSNQSFYVNQSGIYDGPCLWSITPGQGCNGASVTLNGIRFGSDPGNYETDQNNVTFTQDRRASNADFSLWNDTTIRTNVPSAAVDGDVFATVATLQSNALPFDVNCGAGAACSSDPNICVPNPTACGGSLVCNPSCVCQTAGGSGDPCDGDPNTPQCDPNNTLCAPGYSCNATSCTCQSSGGGQGDPCDGDPNTPQCDPNNTLCAPGYSCNATSCECESTGGQDFQVIDHWPGCFDACLNSELGLKLSSAINAATVNNAAIAVFDYRDSNFQQLAGEEQIDVSVNPATNEIYIYPSGGTLSPSFYIRVVVRDDILSSTGQSIQNLNFDENGDGMDDSYAWTFSTSDQTCSLSSIETSPTNMTLNAIGASQTVYGRAISGQQCGGGGYVNPWAYDWNWRDLNGGTIVKVDNLDTDNDGNVDPEQAVTAAAAGNSRVEGAVNLLTAGTDVAVTLNGQGDPCDGDPNTPQCDPDNTFCTANLECNPASCTCQPVTVHQPPGIISVIPTSGQSNVCRNSAVQVVFDQRMDTGSIALNKTFLFSPQNSLVDDQTSGHLNFSSVGLGDYGCANADGCTVVRFTPTNALLANISYRVYITAEVKSIYGVNMTADYTWNFSTGAQICHINSVNIVPAYHLFTQQNESWTYIAAAYSSDNQQLTPITGFYEWSWTWTKYDPDNVVALQPPGIPEEQTVTAQLRNGSADLTATAKITVANTSVGDSIGRQVSDSAEAEVFICLYPWPQVPPMQDGAYGIQTKYCRGNDANDLLGMLSEPGSSVIPVTNPDDPDLVKEYLFTYLPASLSPDPPVINPFLINENSISAWSQRLVAWLGQRWQRLQVNLGLKALAQTATDVIGLRIYENPDRLGPRAWYELKSFPKGNPQDITVDGFPALRDGTSVYILGPKSSGSGITTNIFVLSYNDLSSAENRGIFEQLLANFKFYTLSADQKPKVARDLQRLADATYVMSQAELYKQQTGNYPRLLSGSYLTGVSTSKWPSWQATLGNQLGVTLPVDPINKFASYCGNNPTTSCWQDSDCGTGVCLSGCPEGSNPDTCWNEVTQQYTCPAGSSIYQYRVSGVNSFRVGVLLEYNNYGSLPANLDINTDYCDGQVYTSQGFCGDGIVQPALGEECEIGDQQLNCPNNWANWYDPHYIQCISSGANACHWETIQVGYDCGGYCGDNTLQSQYETCDGTALPPGISNATCYNDCSGFYCNPGYTLQNGVCVAIPSNPSVTINSPANNSSGGNSVAMSYTINQGGTLNFLVDGTSVGGTGNNAGTYSHTFNGLSIGQHVLRVEISNSNGNGSAQVNYSVNAPPPVPPTVTISSPVNGASGGGTVSMTFSTNQGGVMYHQLDGATVYTTGNGPGTYTYTFSGLSTGAHQLGIIVNNTNGTGTAQVAYNVIANPPTVTIMNPPTNTSGGGSVDVTYYISQNGTVSFLVDGSNVGTTGNNAGYYNHTFSGLTDGVHTLAVTITNTNGNDSDQITYNAIVNPPPSAPSGLTTIYHPAVVGNPAYIELNWTDNSNNETSFVVQRAVGTTTNWGDYATVGANVTTYNDNTLTPGNTYFYRVRSVNANGSSTYSNVASMQAFKATIFITNNYSANGDLVNWAETSYNTNSGGVPRCNQATSTQMTANCICTKEANASSQMQPGEYRAWISADNNGSGCRYNAADNFVGAQAGVPLFKTNSEMVATTWNGLMSSSLLSPINRSQTNTLLGGANVWTDTKPNGQCNICPGGGCGPYSCGIWTSPTSYPYRGPSIGNSSYYLSEEWVMIDSPFANNCANAGRLYCVYYDSTIPTSYGGLLP